MPATYDNAKQAIDFGVTTLSSGSFTIGAGADRVAMVCLATVGNPGAISAVSCGGQSGSTTPVASGDSPTWFFKIFEVLNPASGTQSASVTWTNSITAVVTVITATGASGLNGGVYNENVAGNNTSLNFTSSAGDLTASFSGNGNADTVASSNQTQRISGTEVGADTGPGTANPTHTWTHTGNAEVAACGANFVATAPSGYSSPNSDVQTTNWSSTGANFFGVIDEASFDDADYVTSPSITGVGQALICGLTNGPLAAGSYSPIIRASVSAGTATLRIKLLNDSNASQGQVDITVDTTLKRYDPTITITGSATRISFEFFS